MIDIFDETRSMIERTKLQQSFIAQESGLSQNWIFRFVNKKMATPNLAHTKVLNKFMKDHIASLQG